MAKVEAQGELRVEAHSGVRAEAQSVSAIDIQDKDFLAKFDGNSWTVSWHLRDVDPCLLKNKASVYSVKNNIANEFKREVRT